MYVTSARKLCANFPDMSFLHLPLQAGRPFTSGRSDRMAYEDFVCFFMSEVCCLSLRIHERGAPCPQ